MNAIASLYQRGTDILSGTFFESVALLFTRVALAGIFWRSYQTKVEDGTWLTISDVQYFIFENEFAGLPLSPDIAVPLATYAEFAFPILLVAGLASRVSAAALMGMALVIQLFVFPTMDHFLGWAITVIAMAAFIISRGPGVFSLDALLSRFTNVNPAPMGELKAA
ncbi:MAG: DoxX family protein [Erythrobacter sp.]|uniref:DoxX family protein n=1 Tax=Erythrobacter sp. TaxID=1042 RepID=UPI00260CCBCC|nr:DoxX family protein [Erythrobacter sp.]MDJ0979279.1 DoxX family protein [Erythrobacter sp.]